MLYAIDNDNQKILSSPDSRAWCPHCKSTVRAKCGRIKIWHWSHISLKDCDTWSEGETAWHLSWKQKVPKEHTEVTMGTHRADIKLPSGVVIELQNSSIGLDELLERERFYDTMIWLVNCIPIKHNITLFKKNDDYCRIVWKWKKTVYVYSSKKVYLDLGPDVGILLLKKIHHRYGWGVLRSYDEFCRWYGLNIQ